MTPGHRGAVDPPTPGFGTSGLADEEAPEAVETALDVGYRHVDAAQMYGNEAAVGAGIAASSVPRADVFLATKLLHPSVAPSADHDAVVADGGASLERLGVDSVDLLYLHWPADYDLEAAFEAFDTLYEEGAYDHLGVCNFTPELLDAASDLPARPIEVLQVEMHPLLQQAELRAYCAEHDIALVAYSPLLRGKAPEVPELRAIADEHGVTAAQVSLAWVRQQGAVPIPKATSRAHIRENWASRDLELDADDLAVIEGIDREERQVDPPFATW